MFHIYAVALEGDIKHRHFIASESDEFLAKHRANVATCSFADYAYVKDTKGGTVFFIRRPDYETQHNPRPQVTPIQPAG